MIPNRRAKPDPMVRRTVNTQTGEVTLIRLAPQPHSVAAIRAAAQRGTPE